MRTTSSLAKSAMAAVLTVALAAGTPVAAFAQNPTENVDLQMVTKIRNEGFRESKVMEIMSDLSDRIGPRLTGSTNLKRANEWSRDMLTSFGLQNAHLEPFAFGRGWQNEGVTIRMVAPDLAQMYAIPKAWTPGTNGVVKGEIVHLKATTVEDLEKEKGKYAGKIVLISELRDIKPETEAATKRYDDKELAEIASYSIPSDRLQGGGRSFSREDLMRRFRFQRALQQFLQDEKPAVVIEGSRGDAGLIFVGGSQAWKKGEADGVPWVYLAAEQYNRLVRLLDRKVPVQMEVDVKAHFEDNDGNAFNTIAEIPGTDKKDEIVMVGAHLDSWHAGTGATDDGAGVAATMEAVRILQALGVKPRRTIRIALWGGEEQGLLGSRAYVADHFAKREEPPQKPGANNDLPSYMRAEQGKLVVKPEQAKIAAYFNIDNGTGKLRGIYTQENAAVLPIFKTWGAPFADLGFTTVSMRNTGGTDHLSFDAAGIPGFQFIQDPVEYESRTHHSNMDVYERIQRDDMMQMSVVLASFLYDAAMRDEMLPRKPLPKGAEVQQAASEPAKDAKPVKKGNGKKS